jgi:uncharacterized membrane protein
MAVNKHSLPVVGLSVVLVFTGMAMLLDQLVQQVEPSSRYKGIMNSANFYTFSSFIPVTLLLSVVALNKSGVIGRVGGLPTLMMGVVGLVVFWMVGTSTPAAGALNWVGLSTANLQAQRIGWEESNGLLQVTGFCGGLRGSLGLAPFTMPADLKRTAPCDPNNSATSADREDFRIVLAALVMVAIGLVTLVVANIGSTGDVRPVDLNNAVSTTQRNHQLLAFLTFTLGACANFVLMTSNGAADPSHPFYETILGIATYTVLIGIIVLLGVIGGDNSAVQVGLFFAGYFGAASPTYLWQMEALGHTATIHPIVSPTNILESLESTELDSYKVAGTLAILSALAATLTGCLHLGASSAAEKELPNENRIRTVGFIVLGLLVLIACGLQWGAALEALEEIDAEDTARSNAANWYIFLPLLAWLCLFGYSLRNKKTIGLVYVGVGIIASIALGNVNCGTHDRQLWFVDNSLAGVNEQRAFLKNDDPFGTKRAMDVDEEFYEQSFAGSVILALVAPIAFILLTNLIPGDKGDFANSAKVKVTGAITLLFGVLAIVLLVSSGSYTSPSIHEAASGASSATSNSNILCRGKGFNMFIEASSAVCFNAAQTPDGERFTLNLLATANPQTVTDNHHYGHIFENVMLVLFVSLLTLFGVLGAHIPSLKIALLLAFPLYMTLSRAFSLQATGNGVEGDQCRDDECEIVKTGISFGFLTALVALVSVMGVLEAAGEDEEDEEAKATESKLNTPSASTGGDEGVQEGAFKTTQV